MTWTCGGHGCHRSCRLLAVSAARSWHLVDPASVIFVGYASPACVAAVSAEPDRTHGFGKEHTGFKSVHQLWSNRGFTSSVGSLLTGGNYYYEKVAGGPRWQDQHPIYNDSQFVNKPGNCKEQLDKPTAMCTQEYSTALWGQLAVQAVEEHQLPAPIYVHLCFQAVRSAL